jgi:hypothetical protein
MPYTELYRAIVDQRRRQLRHEARIRRIVRERRATLGR